MVEELVRASQPKMKEKDSFIFHLLMINFYNIILKFDHLNLRIMVQSI